MRSDHCRRGALVVVACAGLAIVAGGVEAQPRTFSCCDTWANANKSEFGVAVGYKLIPTNVIQTEAYGTALTLVSAYGIYCGSFACSGSPPNDGETIVAGHAEDLLAPPPGMGLSASADLSPFLWTPPLVPLNESLGAYATSVFDLKPLEGSWKMDTRSISGQRLENYSLNGALINSTWGAGHEIGTGVGGFAVVTKFVRNNPNLPYGVKLIVTSGFRFANGSKSFAPDDPCFPPPNGDECPGPIVISVSSFKIVVKLSPGRGLGTGNATGNTWEGVVARFSDGSIKRLGFFTEKAFDDPNPNDDVSFDTTYTFPVVAPSTQTYYDLATSGDSFGDHDGNLITDNDPSGGVLVCWAEHQDMIGRLGAKIGGAGYSARADFDLDGEITPDDFEAFLERTCTADFNCDGVVDDADIEAYTAAFVAGEKAGLDFDGDGIVDFLDYLAFVDEHDACD